MAHPDDVSATFQEGRRLEAKSQLAAAHRPTATACTIAASDRTIEVRVVFGRAIGVREEGGLKLRPS